jgi:DNA-binding NarL/FixJ family response regulator/signal transduction histidine kinase
MLWLLVGTAALSLYDSDPGTDLSALAIKLGLVVAGLVAVYCVFLRPGLPWVKPVEAPRLWAVVVLSSVLLGLAAWVAQPMGLFQVPLFTILWASAGEKAPVRVMLASALVVGATVGTGTALAQGPITAVLRQIPVVALSVITGLWLRSSWRWSAERRTLSATLELALRAQATAEHEAGVMAERERFAREVHDTIAQSLVAIIMATERAQNRLVVADGREPELAYDLRTVAETALDSLANARALVAEGTRIELEGPLSEILPTLAARFSREMGMPVRATVDLPDDLPEHLRMLVVRAIQEGLANIRKHSRATEAEVRAVLRGEHLRVDVIDDGVGPTEGIVEGGFGLAGLRERVESMGGSMRLLRRPDRSGALLRVEVDPIGPLAALATQSGSDEPEANAESTIRVLVVDDHPIVRQGLVDLLNRAPDITVIGEASTGEEAVEMARRTAPDIVTMDLEMPGNGGVWAIEQILADAAQAGCQTRAVAVTVFDSDARIAQAVRAGASDYLIKGSPREEFARAVRQAAAGPHDYSLRIKAALDSSQVRLTPREAEILRLAARGLSNREIAEELVVQPSTVKTLLSRIYLKLDVSDRTAAVTHSMERELI